VPEEEHQGGQSFNLSNGNQQELLGGSVHHSVELRVPMSLRGQSAKSMYPLT